jgi:hypothetical protein
MVLGKVVQARRACSIVHWQAVACLTCWCSSAEGSMASMGRCCLLLRLLPLLALFLRWPGSTSAPCGAQHKGC